MTGYPNHRRSGLVIDPNFDPGFGSIPNISTFQGSSGLDDSRLSSPRSINSSETQLVSRSGSYRGSSRNDFRAALALKSPLREISEGTERRLSGVMQPWNKTSDVRGTVQFLSPPLDHYRLSTIPPSPRLATPPASPFAGSLPRPKILFYHKHDPHYGFTNFSAHPVVYKGKKYPTSEHLFQSFKFHDHRPGLAEHIRTCSERPSVAFSEARRFQPEVRSDWKNVNIAMMDIALELKFTQHLDLRDELLSTGDAELIEDSDKDAFWGIGADGKGRNELGRALERLREKLRAR